MLTLVRSSARFALLAALVSVGSCSGGGSKDAMPTAPTPVLTTVAVTMGATTLQVGQNTQANASGLDQSNASIATGAVSWSSSAPTVASISASGSVNAVGVGQTQIVAVAGGKTGQATLTVIPVPVASVSVAPATSSVLVGATLQLTATPKDANGNALTGRTVAWASSTPAIASVSASGLVTGVAAGGPVTITATSDGQSGFSLVTVTAAFVQTGIRDVHAFIDHCPTTDAAWATLRSDFTVLSDGVPSGVAISCSEPYSAQPFANMTDELIAWQTLRAALYMGQGTQGKLPWTTLDLYTWMKTSIAGVNLKAAAGQLYCCDVIGGKYYFSQSRQDSANRVFKMDWMGISTGLNFYVHEIRHLTGPGHVTGCLAFPLPTDPAGCDATYDLSNLGSYGTQYWLESNLASGWLNVGIACSSASVAKQYAEWHAGSANSFRARFVSNVPPVVTVFAPYGGVCPSP